MYRLWKSGIHVQTAISPAADRFQPENAPYMPKAVMYND
jgi:hypothetical protein